MRSRSSHTGPPRALAQLRRLRDVRVAAAEAAVRQERDACAQAAAAVEARLGEIAAHRDGVQRHARYTVGEGAADLPHLATVFTGFREQVDERLERSEYALIDDEEALEAAQRRLAERQQAWRREQSRRDGVDDLLVRSRRAEARQVERQAEQDADELPTRTPLDPERP
jgi:hypothetical protein